jgi:hypothetical protein
MEVPFKFMGLKCFGPGAGVSDADAQVNELGKRRERFPFITLSSPQYKVSYEVLLFLLSSLKHFQSTRRERWGVKPLFDIDDFASARKTANWLAAARWHRDLTKLSLFGDPHINQ